MYAVLSYKPPPIQSRFELATGLPVILFMLTGCFVTVLKFY